MARSKSCIFTPPLDTELLQQYKTGADVTVKGEDDVGYLLGPNPDDPDPIWDYREFSGELDIASNLP